MTSSTIPGWIKNTLKLSGVIDVVEYGEHSTYGTSTFNVFLFELPGYYITKTRSWSNESTWKKITMERFKLKKSYFCKYSFL